MAYFLLLLLGAIWGASYLFIKVGVEGGVSPVTLVAVRTTLAGIVLFLVLNVRREKLPPFHAPIWKWLAVLGVLNSVIPYTLITWGEIHVSSGLAAILVGAVPIFTMLFAHWLTHDEKLNARKIFGVIAGFVGVVILFIPDLLRAATANVYGGLAIVAASISYALATIVARKQLKGHSHVTSSFGQMFMASLILIPASLLFEHPWTLTPTANALGAIVTLAVLGTAFAYLMYFWLIANIGATRTSLVTFISPVLAVILGAIVLGERLEWTTWVGLVLIVAGVGLVLNVVLPRPRFLASAARNDNSPRTKSV